MMRFLLPLLLCPVVASAANPISDIVCIPTAQLTQQMKTYGHQRRASGLKEPEQMMEVWADKKGDWAMVMRYASGTSCIVAMGEAWDVDQPKDPA